jgi:hypothetical protein
MDASCWRIEGTIKMNVLLNPFVSLVARSKLALKKPLDDLNAGKVSVKWGTEKVIYLPKHEMLAFNSKQEQVQTKVRIDEAPNATLVQHHVNHTIVTMQTSNNELHCESYST